MASHSFSVRLNTFNTRLLMPAIYLIIVYLTSIDTTLFEQLLKLIFPQSKELIYAGTPPLTLLVDHLKITFYSTFFGLLIAAVLSALVYTNLFKEFKDVFLDFGSMLQTIPSVAVIGIVVPIFGYGLIPVVIALTAYSVLPLLLNIIKGIDSVPGELIEVASGIGLTNSFIIRHIKLPLASNIIKAAIKNVLVINVASATFGALVGAGGLGVPILAGIHDFNPALIVQGSIPSAALALFFDEILR